MVIIQYIFILEEENKKCVDVMNLKRFAHFILFCFNCVLAININTSFLFVVFSL